MAGLFAQLRRPSARSLRWSDTSVQSTSTRYVLFVLLPLWVVPGLLDWYWHKRTDIENTAGIQESIIHSLQMTEVGVPILMGLFFEINPLLLTIMAAAVAVHYATALWDVRLAVHHREVKTAEQHTHSFLEVLPFMGLAFAVCLHGDASRRLLTGNTRRRDWRLESKSPRLPFSYIAGVLGLITFGIALPYANELWRCARRLRKPKYNTGFYKESSVGSQTMRNC